MSQYKLKFNPFTGKFQYVPSDSAIVFKDGVPTVDDLPLTGNSENDARMVQANGHLYIWNGTTWVDQGDFASINWTAIEGKPSSSVSDIDSAVSLKHTQGTDQGLDTGGANAITALQLITLKNVTVPNKIDKLDYYLLNGQSVKGYAFTTGNTYQVRPSYPGNWNLEFWVKMNSIPAGNITNFFGTLHPLLKYHHINHLLTYDIKPLYGQEGAVTMNLDTWYHINIENYSVAYDSYRYLQIYVNGTKVCGGVWFPSRPNLSETNLNFNPSLLTDLQFADIRYVPLDIYNLGTNTPSFVIPSSALTNISGTTLLIRDYNNTINYIVGSGSLQRTGTIQNDVPYSIDATGSLVKTKSDGNIELISGLLATDVQSAVSLKHTQNTDSYLTTQITHKLYVDGNRTDIYIEDGSFTKPFKNIQDAINSVTTATIYNRFTIQIMPGEYNEQIVMKNYVHLVALVPDSVWITSSDGDVVTTSVDANLTNLVLIYNGIDTSKVALRCNNGAILVMNAVNLFGNYTGVEVNNGAIVILNGGGTLTGEADSFVVKNGAYVAFYATVLSGFGTPYYDLTIEVGGYVDVMLLQCYNERINNLGTLILVNPASRIKNIPSGNITSTDVQAAINELDTSKIESTPSGDWKKVTNIEYNIVTGDIRVIYEI